mmetsp:Transcript_39914/g.78473  ORF Transcript_39914/g.78473 Transcript_39914/m.78473 type:complete len:89 (-) Transcript_39914:544-810(-)
MTNMPNLETTLFSNALFVVVVVVVAFVGEGETLDVNHDPSASGPLARSPTVAISWQVFRWKDRKRERERKFSGLAVTVLKVYPRLDHL